VLEWRLDPTGPWCIPQAAGSPGVSVIVMCRQGFSSSLAAASLQAIGVRATDVIGGFEAWRDAGLPVEPFTDPGDPD
jgi:rhodanese-related sulfurtransferase